MNTLEKYIKEFIRNGDTKLLSKENILLNVPIKDIENFVKNNPKLCSVSNYEIRILIHSKYLLTQLIINYIDYDSIDIVINNIKPTNNNILNKYIYDTYTSSEIDLDKLSQMLARVHRISKALREDIIKNSSYIRKFKAGINRVKTFINSSNYTLLYCDDIDGISNTVSFDNNFKLVYLIPEIKVTNTFNKYHIIRDVLIFNLYTFNKEDHTYEIDTYFSRVGFTKAEIDNRYIQSHMSREYFSGILNIRDKLLRKENANIEWFNISKMCLGNNPLKHKFTINSISDLYIHERMVLNTLGWESQEGGPYITFSKVVPTLNTTTGVINIQVAEFTTIINNIIKSLSNNIIKCYTVADNNIDINTEYITECILNDSNLISNPFIYNSFTENYVKNDSNIKNTVMHILDYSDNTSLPIKIFTDSSSSNSINTIGEVYYRGYTGMDIKVPFKIYPDDKYVKSNCTKTINPLIMEVIYHTLKSLILKIEAFVIK